MYTVSLLRSTSPLSCEFAERRCDFFVPFFPNTEKPFLLKINTHLCFNLPLRVLYPYPLRNICRNIFLDTYMRCVRNIFFAIYMRCGKLRVENPSFITLNFKGNHDERPAEDADVKPPRVCLLSLEAFYLNARLGDALGGAVDKAMECKRALFFSFSSCFSTGQTISY